MARHALVACLAGVTALVAVQLRAQPVAPVAIPPASQITAGTGWAVAETYTPAAFTYRQWLVKDRVGDQALLYVAGSSRSVVALAWTGELGYQGAGYEVMRTGEQPVALSDGSSTTVDYAEVQRMSDARLLLYAVASPGGVLTHRVQSLPEAAVQAMAGDSGPYYMVRVSVAMAGSRGTAERLGGELLGQVLPRLVSLSQTP